MIRSKSRITLLSQTDAYIQINIRHPLYFAIIGATHPQLRNFHISSYSPVFIWLEPIFSDLVYWLEILHTI